MLDFFKDIFSAFRQSSLERIKSPFLGAFVFSWIGFNWQMLAILIISKQNIIGRIEYINNQFGIASLLIGPLFTTALICILLPMANKLVTKFQRKTNHDTNELILQSKIDIAEKQLELSNIDAQKKLAEEREKKRIDADINSILKQNKTYEEQLSDQLAIINTLSDNLNKVTNELSHANADIARIDSANSSTLQINQRLNIENTNLLKKLSSVESEIKSLRETKEDNDKVIEKALLASLELKNVKSKLLEEERRVKELELYLTKVKEHDEKLTEDLNGMRESYATLSSVLSIERREYEKAKEQLIAAENKIRNLYKVHDSRN